MNKNKKIWLAAGILKMEKVIILTLLFVLISSVALAHEGEPVEEHSFFPRAMESTTLRGGLAVLVIVALVGYLVVKNRRSAQNKNSTQKQEVHTSEKIMTGFIILVIIIAATALIFAAKSIFFPASAATAQNQQVSDHFGAGGFTEYDLALARELMDKDGDGKCDVCGMDIQFCIENGQLQCNMGQKTGKLDIGILDKTKQEHHYHADFKVVINGEVIDFNKPEYFVKSRFMHVENDAQGDSGKVLHMHATGVPLWLFFESVGMRFDEECFAAGSEEYCTSGQNALKFYVNGKSNEEFGDYVFKDNDRLLISYRGINEDVSDQIASVTMFSSNH